MSPAAAARRAASGGFPASRDSSPVKALARLFRRLFLAALEAAFDKGELLFFGELASLGERRVFAERIASSLRKTDWIVYAKPPFGGPEQVLAYLARYTHRAAIANSRLVAAGDDEVAFTYKDYRRHGRHRLMRLSPEEFIRRFLLHVLPDGFHRIRHYGLMAKGDREERLALCRRLAGAGDHPVEPKDRASDNPAAAAAHTFPCPDCGGIMRRIGAVSTARARPFRCDTS